MPLPRQCDAAPKGLAIFSILGTGKSLTFFCSVPRLGNFLSVHQNFFYRGEAFLQITKYRKVLKVIYHCAISTVFMSLSMLLLAPMLLLFCCLCRCFCLYPCCWWQPCCWKCFFCCGPVLAGMHPGIIVMLQHDVLAVACSSLVHVRKVFWLLKVDLLHFPSPKKSSGPRSKTFTGKWDCKRSRSSDQNTFPTWVMKKISVVGFSILGNAIFWQEAKTRCRFLTVYSNITVS